MIRKIIEINQEKCNGCGACTAACHEGAIGMIGGKATLLRDDYCDGLGDCLPACPAEAISFVEREAAAYDAAMVSAHLQQRGCPGAQAREVSSSQSGPASAYDAPLPGRLRQWPVQIKLLPIRAPYFQEADLLVAADCTAYAYGDFHRRFMDGRVTLIGCPKLDQVDYAEKLSDIFRENDVKSVTVARMEVPCCGGLEYAVKRALQAAGKEIPCRVVTISIDGKIIG